MITNITVPSDHFHVMAVQDWGGSQEYGRGWDDQLSRADAEQMTADIVECDTAYAGFCGSNAGMAFDSYEAARQKYGDERFSELASTNVAPGWDAVWVVKCEQSCRFEDLFHGKRPEQWGEPLWTRP